MTKDQARTVEKAAGLEIVAAPQTLRPEENSPCAVQEQVAAGLSKYLLDLASGGMVIAGLHGFDRCSQLWGRYRARA